MQKIKWGIKAELVLLAAAVCVFMMREISDGRRAQKEPAQEAASETGEAVEVSADGSYIKWVDFNVTCEAMSKAYELDVDSYQEEVHLDWIELLAYVGAKHGGISKAQCPTG